MMEERLSALLSQLDAEQTEILLAHGPELKAPPASARRIRAAVYAKAGLKTRVGALGGAASGAPGRAAAWSRPGLRAAMVAAVLLLCLGVIGVDKVAAAIGGLFGLVPGYGIVEGNDTILYIAAERPVAADKNSRLTLLSAMATADTVSVSYEADSLAIYGWREFAIYLYADEQRYESSGGSRSRSSGGGVEGIGKTREIGYYDFTLPPEAINTKTVYRLELAQCELGLEFTLQALDSYDDLTAIGATDTHHDIAVTALPYFSEDSVMVELYPTNNSKYRLEGYYSGLDYTWHGQDMQLQTASGPREPLPVGFLTMPVGRFSFAREEGDGDLTLTLPFLLAQTGEEQVVGLPIPPLGEQVTLNKQVQFEDCTLIFESAEQTPAEYGDGYDLRLTVRADNNQPDVIWRSVMLNRSNRWGHTDSGGCMWQVDEDGVMRYIYYPLDGVKGNTLWLKLERPSYYLLGEYNLPLLPK